MQNENILIIGEHYSGKTSLIARICVSLENSNTKFKLIDIPENATYYNSILEPLLKIEFPDRTRRGNISNINLNLNYITENNVRSINIHLPDESGESYEQIVEDCFWSNKLEELFNSSIGYIMTLREGNFKDGLNVITCRDWMKKKDNSSSSTEDRVISDNNQEEQDQLPSQIFAIQWIQFINYYHNKKDKPKPIFVIVITGWDEIQGDEHINQSPIDYIKSNFPMLHQFIESNSKNINFKAVGSSIFGGNLEDIEFKEIAKNSDPNEIGYIIYQSSSKIEKTPDFSSIITWILEEV